MDKFGIILDWYIEIVMGVSENWLTYGCYLPFRRIETRQQKERERRRFFLLVPAPYQYRECELLPALLNSDADCRAHRGLDPTS